jgi:hypothetical protein
MHPLRTLRIHSGTPSTTKARKASYSSECLFINLQRQSSNNLEWVSDEEFDDSSYVLQFEDENQVRLVAFTGTPDFLYDPATLRDVSLSQNEFYWILQVWHDRFNDEWISLPKRD